MPNQISTQIVHKAPSLDDVFQALADPTRRAVVQQLSLGPSSVSTLAQPFDMALPSFTQHLGVLERCGVIRSHKVGRVRTCEIVPETMILAEEWMCEQRKYWEVRLDALVDYLENEEQVPKK